MSSAPAERQTSKLAGETSRDDKEDQIRSTAKSRPRQDKLASERATVTSKRQVERPNKPSETTAFTEQRCAKQQTANDQFQFELEVEDVICAEVCVDLSG